VPIDVEQIGLARVGYYLTHRNIGPALVEQLFDQMIGAPIGPVATQNHQRRLLMELILIIVVVLLVFGGGGYWGRGRGYW
jgi:hypothetical protein